MAGGFNVKTKYKYPHNAAGEDIGGCCCNDNEDEEEEEDDNPPVDVPDLTCDCIVRTRYTVPIPAHALGFDTTGIGSCVASICTFFSGLDIILDFIGEEADVDTYLQGIFVGGPADYCGDGPQLASQADTPAPGTNAYYYWGFAQCYCGQPDAINPAVNGYCYGFHAFLAIKKDCTAANFSFRSGQWGNQTLQFGQTAKWSTTTMGIGDLTDVPGLCTGESFTLAYDSETTFNGPPCTLAGPLLDMDFNV